MPVLRKSRLSFQTKVLLPVLAFLILAPVITSWIVHRRVSAQFERDAQRKLETAEKIFESSREIRGQFLRSRYRNLVQEPRFKACASLFQNPDDREKATATMKAFLQEIITETAGDRIGANDAKILLFTSSSGENVAYSGDPKFRAEKEFSDAIGDLIERAMETGASAELVVVGNRLFNAISTPVKKNDEVMGVFTAGVPIDASTAHDFAAQTGSQIALVAGSNIVATTLAIHDAHRALSPILANLAHDQAQRIIVGDEHFRALADVMPALPKGQQFGCILLSSFEQSHRELLQTQAILWIISLGGTFVSGFMVWLIIGRVTEPLRRLRDSAESVGRGDFTTRLEVATEDEIGALSQTFNQMTANLQTSRAELEKTVETLKATQNQLIQREKLSAVGEFVSGVAHELNNPLTSMIGYAELLKMSGVTPEQSERINLIVRSSQRCHKIVQSLLSFARQRAPERKIVNVSELLDSVLELLAYEMRTSNVEIMIRCESGLPKIIGDTHQLQQVIVNILNNARQAIQSQKPDGQVRIVAERAAHMVRITISDNGPGIAPENISKIFDPFFTTKPVGQGTGLGLSLCYGMIKEHDGSISVASEPGAGATFTIELPIPSTAALVAVKGGDPTKIPAAHSPGKRILVVDDEEWILTLTRKVLEDEGYKVDIVSDGAKALRAVQNTDYDLLVCDQKMPGLSGPQLYERLVDSQSSAAERVIFMTGDVISEDFKQFLDETRKSFLAKPFSLTQLRTAVAEALQNS